MSAIDTYLENNAKYADGFSKAARPIPPAGESAFVAFIATWTAISEFGLVPKRFLPLPWTVGEVLWRVLVERNFIEDIGISVPRVWGAFLLSVIMAVPLGVWMSFQSRQRTARLGPATSRCSTMRDA